MLETPGGALIHGMAHGRRAGREAVFSARTVHLQLSRERPASAHNVWPARVKSRVFQGDFTQYHLDWDGRRLVLRCVTAEPVAEGTELFLSVDPRHCVLLEEESPPVVGSPAMKITDVRLTLFGWDDIPATTYGRHTGRFSGKSQLGLVTIETDEGVHGHAFLGSSMRGAHIDGQSLIQYLKPVVLGQDPLARERLYQAMWHKNRQTTFRAIGAMDVALWDIAGKAAGLPIHRLLGSYRESVPAYASSAVLPSKEAYAEEALRFKADGWTAYKIHPPTDPVVDIEVCRAVRWAVGDEFRVMLDSTWAYQYPEALRVGKVVEDLGYYWYEDPLADDDILNYVKLKQHLAIPILATEYSPGGLTAFAPGSCTRPRTFSAATWR